MLANMYVRAYNVSMIKLKNENKKTEGEEKKMQATFTYHCFESELSTDAELWHHTKQRVDILYQVGWDKVDKEVGPMFHVRFADGLEYDVFNDELDGKS